nr:PAS domain-containing sensor histidine kinase [Ramlibacter albus]
MQRKARLAQALRETRDRYHRTVDSVLDAIVAVDESQNIILFNPAAERMFGLMAAEAIGTPLERLLPARARGRHAGHIRDFVRSGSPSRGMAPQVETTALRSDGTEFPVESTISHTIVDGKPQVTAVLRDVTERNRAERELREMNRQLRALSTSLQNVREEERTRIASELHDELGQQLTGLKLGLSWLGGRVKGGKHATAEEVDTMRRQLDTAITSVRRIATELRPRVLDDRTLDEAFAFQATEFAQRSGLVVEIDTPAASRVASDAMATALYRIVQESLTNVVRHARAKRVDVHLTLEDSDLVLRVRDDGTGLPHEQGQATGIGLVSMRERAMSLGGSLVIDSGPGRGTTVEVRLPLHDDVVEEEPA